MVKVSGDIKLTGLPLQDQLTICKINLGEEIYLCTGRGD